MRIGSVSPWLTLLISMTGALAVGGCTRASESTSTQTSQSGPAAARSGELADSTKAARQERAADGQSTSAAAAGRDACALITATEVTEITGLPIDRVEKISNGCDWYATAAAMQQAGVDSARSTLQQMNKQEPKSADEGMRTMQNLLTGLRGAAEPKKPLFEVLVTWDNADVGEATLKGTIGVIGAGMPGAGLEPVEGIGDRAYYGVMGTVFYARKGPVLVQFGYMGNREQAIALAKKVVSRI